MLSPWQLTSLVLVGCLATSHPIQAVTLCETSNLNPSGVGSSGVVLSSDYPSSIQSVNNRECTLTIHACANCRIQLTLTLPHLGLCASEDATFNNGKCMRNCNYMVLYEPDYQAETTRYYYQSNESALYTSLSSRIYLIYCQSTYSATSPRKFLIHYIITEKYFVSSGSSLDENTTGYITSANFPSRYVLSHNEVFTYLINNTDPNGLIRLGFDDWILSPNSKITIYSGNQTSDALVTRRGDGKRLFLLSVGPQLLIRFETGEDIYATPYLGFKAVYQLVSDPYWPDKPYHVCGEYYHSLYGGHFSFVSDTCNFGDYVDCLWVVIKYQDSCCINYHTHVALRIDSYDMVPGADSLEVRSGNTSLAPLEGIFTNVNLTGKEFTNNEGFYVRLRATCSNARHFHAIFTSYALATADGECQYHNHFACGNGRCISKTLFCDGIDHCGDGTDEQGCTTPAPASICPTYMECTAPGSFYCPMDRCNHKWDCPDGSDEDGCWITDAPWTTWVTPGGFNSFQLGTYVPIGLVAVLLAIITCVVISCCARRKRNAQRRRQRALARLPSLGNGLPGERLASAGGGGGDRYLNINVEINYPDSPPTYEEAMSVETRYTGVYNWGFTSNDPADCLPQPPPYTPVATDPLPIVHHLVARTSSSVLPLVPPPRPPAPRLTNSQAENRITLARLAQAARANHMAAANDNVQIVNNTHLPHQGRRREISQLRRNESTEEETTHCPRESCDSSQGAELTDSHMEFASSQDLSLASTASSFVDISMGDVGDQNDVDPHCDITDHCEAIPHRTTDKHKPEADVHKSVDSHEQLSKPPENASHDSPMPATLSNMKAVDSDPLNTLLVSDGHPHGSSSSEGASAEESVQCTSENENDTTFV